MKPLDQRIAAKIAGDFAPLTFGSESTMREFKVSGRTLCAQEDAHRPD
jgi:hypothetical protein